MSHLARSTSWLPKATLVTVLATIIVGCGRASDKLPIRGQVSYLGAPIAKGVITFYPEHGRATTTAIDVEGNYSVELAPGDYAVTVNLSITLPPGWKEGDPVPRQEVVLPTEYTTRARSPLTATVSENQEQPIDFVLE